MMILVWYSLAYLRPKRNGYFRTSDEYYVPSSDEIGTSKLRTFHCFMLVMEYGDMCRFELQARYLMGYPNFIPRLFLPSHFTSFIYIRTGAESGS